VTPTSTQRSSRRRSRASTVAFVLGIVWVALAAVTRTAEASPFVIHVSVSGAGGGGGGSSSGGGGAPIGGGGGGLVGPVGGTSQAVSPSKSVQGAPNEGAPVESTIGDPLDGVPLGGIDSTVHLPNTSPFGSSNGSPSAWMGTRTNSGGGSVALLDLGNGNSLSVSKAVADSLASVVNSSSVASDSHTNGVTNHVMDSTQNVGGSPTPVVLQLPDLGAGLITFPGSTPTTNVVPGLAADMALVPNPEPATLILLGTGLIFVAKRHARRTN
jgi:PEP-CTERM motif